MRISDWSSDVCSSDLEYPASKAERHGKEHRGRAPKGTKCHVEQQKDAREAERHHDRESLRGRLQAFEFAAPFEVIARRQLHLRDLLLRFGDKGARNTAFPVPLHAVAPLAMPAADLVKGTGRAWLWGRRVE